MDQIQQIETYQGIQGMDHILHNNLIRDKITLIIPIILLIMLCNHPKQDIHHKTIKTEAILHIKSLTQMLIKTQIIQVVMEEEAIILKEATTILHNQII